MKMVRSDLASSGVIFTLDTESGFRDVVFITGAYGLGENVVQGAVDPDEFYVHKPTFEQGTARCCGARSAARRSRWSTSTGDARAHDPQRSRPRRPTASASASSDDDVLELADYAIDDRSATTARPMDIEWAKDGVDGKLYIVQARPETVASQRRRPRSRRTCSRATGRATVLVEGRSVGEKVAVGRVRI